MKSTLVKELRFEQLNGRGMSWPDLSIYSKPDIKDIWVNLSEDVKYIFLIFEIDNSTTIGNQLTLDLHAIGHVIVRSVTDDSELGSVLGVTDRPGVAVIAKDDQDSVIKLAVKSQNCDELLKAIELFLKSHKFKIPKTESEEKKFVGNWMDLEIPSNQELMDTREKEAMFAKISTMGDAVFQADLETALRYSIYNEIAKYSHIKGDTLKALQDYIVVLSKYLYIGPGGQAFLDNLKHIVFDVKDEITGNNLFLLIQSMEKYRPAFSANQWLGCKGSKPSLRGFPCGMWTLFHQLTVSAAQQSESNAQEILQAMHGYIKHFFGCSDCSKHFQEMAAKNKIWNVVGSDEAIIWLWSAHNEVNNRLSGDVTEDSQHPKIQFPSTLNCPQCHKQQGWDHYEVLHYIKQIHARPNISLLGVDLSVYLAHRNSYSSGMFSKIDINICIILYIACGAVIIFAIRFLLKKKYRKKMYVYDILGKV